MYSAIHSLPPLDFQGSLDGSNLLGDPCLVLTSDPKPRLRWTAELHDRFVDAVTQLGGPDKATPKTIMRTMGVKGLTLYHLKSHLQKYRLGKLACKDFLDGSKDVESLDTGSSTPTSSSSKNVHDLNEGYQVTEALRVQMEVQRRLHDQLEVQRRLQLRIEVQGKYLQSILEKACKAIISDHHASSGASISLDLLEAAHEVEKSKNMASNMPVCFTQGSTENPISPQLLKKRTRPSFNDDGIVDTLPLENGMRQMGWMMTN